MERGWNTPRMAVAVLLPCLFATAALGQSESSGNRRESIAWARGTVRDEDGKPIAGAKVYARGTFHGGLRMEGLLRTAVADEEGAYVIHGPGGLSSFSASLVAHVPGHPPALSWFRFPDTFQYDPLFGPPPSNPRWADIDLVVPRRGGALEVLVLKDGSPLRSASVALRLEGADPFDTWGREWGSDEVKALYDICRPTATTGADGLAKFDGISPGLYSVLVIEGPWRQRGPGWANEFQDWYLWSETRPYGHSKHIAVRTGDVSSHQVSVFSHNCIATFQILRDGKPWKDVEAVGMDGVLAGGERATIGMRVGGDQADSFRFDTAGLYPVSFTRAVSTRSYPRSFPFFSAEGLLAVSPRLSNGSPITLAAVENHGGMVRVRMEDAKGQPLTGTAGFSGRRSGGLGCHSGDREVAANGTLIQNFEPTAGVVKGNRQGIRGLVLTEKTGRMPARDELIGRTKILPQPFLAENNRLGEVTLREERVGYVRGRLKAPAGRKSNEYQIWIGQLEHQKGAGIYYERETGEFVAGPYRSGEAVFLVREHRSRRPILYKKADVLAGEVTDVAIEIRDDAEQLAPHERILTARVVLDDGTTPVCLAALGYYSPAEKQAELIGTTDTGGTARPHWLWASDDADLTERPGTPQVPVAVAWAPGRRGAAIVPFPERLEDPLVIQLPPPISLRGKVVVEGDGVPITNGTLIVRAQYEGRGKLDDWLSVETTASADGAFELSGLTPGKYRVQAALDGIWLSKSMEVTAGDQARGPIQLDIPPPGGPVLVRLSGKQTGMPLKLDVDRPAGPLAERLWPKSLIADGAAVVRIPALEAGRHVIRIGSVEKGVELLSLKESKGRPVEIEFDVE